MDCFTWSHADISGIDESVITHKLNIDEGAKLVKQKKKIAHERNKIINKEVEKLLSNKSILEV